MSAGECALRCECRAGKGEFVPMGCDLWGCNDLALVPPSTPSPPSPAAHTHTHTHTHAHTFSLSHAHTVARSWCLFDPHAHHFMPIFPPSCLPAKIHAVLCGLGAGEGHRVPPFVAERLTPRQ